MQLQKSHEAIGALIRTTMYRAMQYNLVAGHGPGFGQPVPTQDRFWYSKERVMRMKLTAAAVLLVITVTTGINWITGQAHARGGGPRPQPVVYVDRQGLYYDSIVAADPLPPLGPFQRLYPPGTHSNPDVDTLWTEFGPGDPGHVGGRWWMDTNWNGEMDAEDHFFSCPLLGPGREEP